MFPKFQPRGPLGHSSASTPPEKSTRQRLPSGPRFARAVVNPSMTPARGAAPRNGFSAAVRPSETTPLSRHAKCLRDGWRKTVSHSFQEHVNFPSPCPKQVPSQQGIFSTHGHSGRFLVGCRFPVVSSPDCEALFPQGHFFRGSGAGAALTTLVVHPMSAPVKRSGRATLPLNTLSIRATPFPRRPRNVRRPEEAHPSQARARVCSG